MDKVPILFVVFNRPAKTAIVLKELAKYKPDTIYLAADGPRNGVKEDLEKCNEVRRILDQGIVWPCTIHRLYRESNEGCRSAVSKAINWFFSHEPYGVILEDDCVPDLSFFEFASFMLRRHEHNSNIHSISGCNLGYDAHTAYSSFYARYMNMWGWATWRRVAVNIDYDLNEWKYATKLGKYVFLIKQLTHNLKDLDLGWIKIWKDKFDLVAHKNYSTWDYQWFYYQFKTNALTVFPSANLIQNIGYDFDATHTKLTTQNSFPLQKVVQPFTVPGNFKVDINFEEKIIKSKWVTYARKPLLPQLYQLLVYTPLKELYKLIYYIFFVKRGSMSFRSFSEMGIHEYKRQVPNA